MITALDFAGFNATEITQEQYNQMVRDIYGDSRFIFKIPTYYFGNRNTPLVGFMEYGIYVIPVIASYPDELFDSSEADKIRVDDKEIPVININWYEPGSFTDISTEIADDVVGPNGHLFGHRCIIVGGYIWEHLEPKYLERLFLFNVYQIIMNIDNAMMNAVDKFVGETIGGDEYITCAEIYCFVLNRFINEMDQDIINSSSHIIEDYERNCRNFIFNEYRKERISKINRYYTYSNNGFHLNILDEKVYIAENQ